MTKWTAVVLCLLSLAVVTACGAGNTALRETTWSNSKTWSGYAVVGGHYTEVSASWVEPSVDCSVAPTVASKYWEAALFWAGLDGLLPHSTVEQTGTSVICEYQNPIYKAWYELYPEPQVQYSNLVKAGDKISASVTTDGNGHFTLILADSSEGWSRRTSATFTKAELASAEVIAEDPGPPPDFGEERRTLADFGTVSFTRATANGVSFSDVNGLHNIAMEPRYRKLMASTSRMANGAFYVTWKHS